MSSKAVECPLCFKNFSLCNIENHVQNCGEASVKVKDNKSSLKRKSEVEFQSNGSESKTQFELDCNELSPAAAKCSKVSEHVNDDADMSNNDVSKAKFSSVSLHKLSFTKPLYDMARPTSLKDYVGQTEVIGKDTVLHKLLKDNIVPSMILWGPPGCGKSTLAHIIANNVKQGNETSKNKIHFMKLSATDSGKADLQSAIKAASNKQRMLSSKTILFIDEIHRFNKLQQDSLLPPVENGTITLIGATTENPSFVLNSALLSRCQVIVLKKLETDDVKSLLMQTISSLLSQVKVISNSTDCNLLQNNQIYIKETAIKLLANLCDGDARIALKGLQTALETVQLSSEQKIVTSKIVKECLQRSHYLYDKTGDQHFDIISALHKSIRGGDDNAALYWLTRMILGGEDPRYIARRMIRIASEDIGLADPSAMNHAVACFQACMFVGMPECDVSLAQCAIYLARAPKSIEVYQALRKAKQCIKENVGPLPSVPLHLRNAPTKLLKDLGCGRDYKYTPEDPSEQSFMPDQLACVNFFA